MRELAFSVGITFLTGTLLFVYFRNKMNNIDKKVNLVFETIQEHNTQMQAQAQMEMQRFAAYQESRMTQQEQKYPPMVNETNENVQQVESDKQGAWNSNANSDTNLIDVSEDESGSESESDGFESSEEEDNGEQNDDDVKPENVLQEVTLEDDSNLKIGEGLEGLEVLDSDLTLEEKKLVQPNVNYSKLTKAKLISLCEDAGIAFKKSSNKNTLIQLLEQNKPSTDVNLEE